MLTACQRGYSLHQRVCRLCGLLPNPGGSTNGPLSTSLGVTDWIRSLFQRGGLGTPEKNPTEYVGGKNRKLLCPPQSVLDGKLRNHSGREFTKERIQDCLYGKWHLGDEAWYPENRVTMKILAVVTMDSPPSFFDPYNNPKHRHPTIRAGYSQITRKKTGGIFNPSGSG